MEPDAGRREVVKALVAAVAATSPRGQPVDEWTATLAPIVRLEAFGPGDLLVEHHAVAHDLHFLVDGRVRYEHLVAGDGQREVVSGRRMPWMPIGWSGLHFGRHRATAVAASPVRLLSLPLAAWDELSVDSPTLWAHLWEFTFRTATRMLWVARGVGVAPTPTPAATPATAPDGGSGSFPPVALAPDGRELREMFRQSAGFSALPEPCRDRLARDGVVHLAPGGTRLLEEGGTDGGLWLLLGGRVALRAAVMTGDGLRTAVRHAVRPGTLLCWSVSDPPLPAPYEVEATRDTTVVRVPPAALQELVRDHPDWGGAVFRQQLWQLRSYLTATRTRHGGRDGDGGVGAVVDLIEDSKPILPVNSHLYGVPHLLRSRLTRHDGFERLYRAHLEGADSERGVASLSLDLLRDLERAHRWFTDLQATYAAVVDHQHLEGAELRRLSSRYFRDALSHIPYVISGFELLPDDPNCIFIYNHMAYADESILPNGFLFNPDSHFISSIVLEPKYGDGIRVARSNAATEFWRADYYERLGHISVVTPESGWRDETDDEKQRRKDRFLADCRSVLASGQPFAIAPEGTITQEDSVTERSPGPLRAGAFLMGGRFPSRPRIVPVALANFDRPPHDAVFSCVIKPAFTMEERGVDVEDRDALAEFLTSYRREFRGHVEEASELAERLQGPEADLSGLLTNIDGVDAVNEEFEHEVRALELGPARYRDRSGATVFYGSSTIRQWATLADDLDVPDAVNLGFGGSTLEACRVYFERLVLPHEPTRLIVYGGDNDISRGASPEFVASQFRALADLTGTHLPAAWCWFISIKPSPGRHEHLPAVERANERIAAEVAVRDRWGYVDWFPYLLDDRGRPDRQLFEPDLVHVNVAGYGILANLLRRVLAEEP